MAYFKTNILTQKYRGPIERACGMRSFQEPQELKQLGDALSSIWKAFTEEGFFECDEKAFWEYGGAIMHFLMMAYETPELYDEILSALEENGLVGRYNRVTCDEVRDLLPLEKLIDYVSVLSRRCYYRLTYSRLSILYGLAFTMEDQRLLNAFVSDNRVAQFDAPPSVWYALAIQRLVKSLIENDRDKFSRFFSNPDDVYELTIASYGRRPYAAIAVEQVGYMERRFDDDLSPRTIQEKLSRLQAYGDLTEFYGELDRIAPDDTP